MFTVTKYPNGAFCWVECSSSDQAAGEQFYAKLMGWTIERSPIGGGMEYTMFKLDGKDVAGMGPLQPGMPVTVWNNMISVDTLGGLPDKVRQLGGVVLSEPFDVLTNGRMMVLQDPTGAAVTLWQPLAHIGSGLVNTPGSFTWNELATRDPQKAMDFYGGLLGWTFQPSETQPGYYFIFNHGRINGGIITMDDSWAGLPPHWMPYFSVKDIHESVKKVEALGGKVSVPPTEIPTNGTFSVIHDPQGGTVTLIQLLQPQPWEA